MGTSEGAARDTAPHRLDIRVIIDRFVYRTSEEMCAALLVAEVIVAGHGASRWDTPDGARPPGATERDVLRGGHAIYTPVSFCRVRIYRDRRRHPGHAPTDCVTCGGRVGADWYRASGLPQLDDGGHYLVVCSTLSGDPARTEVESPLLVYDASPIDASGRVMLQHAGSLDDPGAGALQPEIALPLAEVARRLAACP